MRLCSLALAWTVLLIAARGSVWATGLTHSGPVATPIALEPCEAPGAATPLPTPSATEEIPLGVGPTPTPAPDPEATIDPALEPMTAAAAANLQACWNTGDWQAVAGFVTPRFLETAFGVTAMGEHRRAAALAKLDLGSLRIESLGPIRIWSDGRGAVDVLYWRGHDRPMQAVAARWFFIAERGTVTFDEEVLQLPPPLGDRATIGFAVADDAQPLRWSASDGGHVPTSPITALHGANRGRQAHTFLLQDTNGTTLGLLTLPSWQQGDLVLRDLPAGSYRLLDPAVPGSTLDLVVG